MPLSYIDSLHLSLMVLSCSIRLVSVVLMKSSLITTMGTGSKVFSAILRLGELCSSVIVVTLLGRFFYLLYLAPDGSIECRLIYAEVISCLETIASILPSMLYFSSARW